MNISHNNRIYVDWPLYRTMVKPRSLKDTNLIETSNYIPQMSLKAYSKRCTTTFIKYRMVKWIEMHRTVHQTATAQLLLDITSLKTRHAWETARCGIVQWIQYERGQVETPDDLPDRQGNVCWCQGRRSVQLSCLLLSSVINRLSSTTGQLMPRNVAVQVITHK